MATADTRAQRGGGDDQYQIVTVRRCLAAERNQLMAFSLFTGEATPWREQNYRSSAEKCIDDVHQLGI